MIESPKAGLIVALDGMSAEEVRRLADQLKPDLCRLKVGKELFVRAGPEVVRELQTKGFKIFLDLKFHDIPNTVGAACRAARELGVWMCTVHASGGPRMIAAAHSACGDAVKVVAVTVLTSLDDSDLEKVGQKAAADQVRRLSRLAQHAGLSGVVCSAKEAALVREGCGEDFLIVTPGIRLQALDDDQKRTVTPQQAVAAGADHLVVGRPITQAADPLAVVQEINALIH